MRQIKSGLVKSLHFLALVLPIKLSLLGGRLRDKCNAQGARRKEREYAVSAEVRGSDCKSFSETLQLEEADFFEIYNILMEIQQRFCGLNSTLIPPRDSPTGMGDCGLLGVSSISYHIAELPQVQAHHPPHTHLCFGSDYPLCTLLCGAIWSP